MIANPTVKTRVYRFADFIWFFLLFVVADQFRRAPRPRCSSLIAGIDRAGHPLSESQLNRLQTWLRSHQKGWKRSTIPPPPILSSDILQIEDSDHTVMFVFFVPRERLNVYFSKHTRNKRFDAGWLSLPTKEYDYLVGLLRPDA